MGVPGIQTNQTPFKIVNGLNPNVVNTRPEELIWQKIQELRLEHSLNWAGLFLSSTCAVNLSHYRLFEAWEHLLLSHGSTGRDLKEESQWQIFTFSAKMVALLSRSKTQKARKLSLQCGIEISYVIDKILEIKIQWNLMDISVPSQVDVWWELCASKSKILDVLQAHIFILSLEMDSGFSDQDKLEWD